MGEEVGEWESDEQPNLLQHPNIPQYLLKQFPPPLPPFLHPSPLTHPPTHPPPSHYHDSPPPTPPTRVPPSPPPQVGAWVLGEFGHMLGGDDGRPAGDAAADILCDLLEGRRPAAADPAGGGDDETAAAAAATTRRYAAWGLAKLAPRCGGGRPAAAAVEAAARYAAAARDTGLQQRCAELAQLAERPALLRQVRAAAPTMPSPKRSGETDFHVK